MKDDRRRINATEMDALRRSARISKLRVDKKTNEYIREKMDVPDTILDEITRNNSIGMDMSTEWTQRGYKKL
jgi:hypothetical protein